MDGPLLARSGWLCPAAIQPRRAGQVSSVFRSPRRGLSVNKSVRTKDSGSPVGRLPACIDSITQWGVGQVEKSGWKLIVRKGDLLSACFADIARCTSPRKKCRCAQGPQRISSASPDLILKNDDLNHRAAKARQTQKHPGINPPRVFRV